MRKHISAIRWFPCLALLALLLFMTSAAQAERVGSREWRSSGTANPLIDGSLPLVFRSSAGTTWVDVGHACDASDTIGSPDGQTPAHVWCFEGANGDSTWPSVPPAQNTGSKKETFDHWSRFAPPLPPPSKWHITERFGNFPVGGNFNAWCGCDSLGTNPSCDDIAFWIFQEGYGDEWNYSLTLDTSGQDAGSGGTIEFDLRYDTECKYDYLYLEYLDTTSGMWTAVTDTSGTQAVFNAISGNPDFNNGGTGRVCGDDIYGHSDQADLGGGNQIYHGNSIWLEDVTFPMPTQTDGMQLRWRGESDQAWSDADGLGDTDGLGAIDNVRLTFTASGVVVTDDFETGNFSGISATSGTASWIPGGIQGQSYDGWHLSFDPMYKNKGNTCTFSDDWMWAAKPDTGPIPSLGNGFSFFLATPVIDCNGWSGGVVEYANYMCAESAREDYTNSYVRVYDATLGGWSLWSDFDSQQLEGGCEFWNVNEIDDLSPYLGDSIDSLQVSWELVDVSLPSDFSWGKHGGVTFLVDNVSFGSFSGEATVFTARAIDLFADTFSLSDPAHTPFLQNAEQGDWTGHSCSGFNREFANADSLSIEINDFNGLTEANVTLWWRHDDGGSAFGSWNSKAMDFSVPDPTSPTDEGTYRQIIGADDGGVEDPEGTAGNCLIWKAGTTVEYYVSVTDNLANTATFPNDLDTTGSPFQFSVLPLGNATPSGERILIIDDYTRNALDFENSTAFNPIGGAGFGAFGAPTFVQPENLVADALDLLYPPAGLGNGIVNANYLHHFDKYDVQGAGSSVQCEPRGVSNIGSGVGGFMNDLGQPTYDALIWLQGTFDDGSYADTTRIDLAIYLDNGGKLFSNGDQVAFHLGAGGNNADSTLGFLETYLGISFGSSNDESTDSRVLNVTGVAAPYVGDIFGIYGECPIRRTFDRLTLAAPAPGSTNEVLMVYSDGGAGDNGRPAVISNTRVGGGVAIHSGFGISAMLDRNTMGCLLRKMLVAPFGFQPPAGLTDCQILSGVDVPVVATSHGFSLEPSSPNPFANRTSISFSVAARGHVAIDVYNILGQKIRTLVDETMEPDSYVREWDGRSDRGERVSSGIYFYKMVAGSFSDTRKTVLLR